LQWFELDVQVVLGAAIGMTVALGVRYVLGDVAIQRFSVGRLI
jgi:hypothetical protein